MTKILQEIFDRRLQEAVTLIKSFNINYEALVIFGSYARNEFKGSSDIDLCMIIKERPSRRVSGELRELLEIKGVDLVFVTPEYFQDSNDRFAVNLRNDWRELNEKSG